MVGFSKDWGDEPMATLMARIKEEGKFRQAAVEFDKRRPKRPAGATSYFILTRDASGKRMQAGDSYKDLDVAVAALASVEAMEASEKLIGEDFQANEDPATITGTWAALQAEYVDRLRLEVKKGNLKASSEKRYLRSFREFNAFLTTQGIISLKDITPKVFNTFKEHRIDAGAGRAFVNDTKNLNPVFEYAVKQEMILRNPVEYENPQGDAERGAQPFSATELKAMQREEVLKGDKLAFWLLYQTGLRKGDAMDLRWSGVNGYITRLAQKNGKRVRIPILPELKAALDAEREKRNPGPNDYVLLNPETGNPYTGNRIYDRLQKLGKGAGVENVHPHRFRDTFAADCFLRGCNAEEVAAYLGDDLKTLLKHYAEFITERADRADEKLMNGRGLMHAATV
jgi:integrase/recombinase XerD